MLRRVQFGDPLLRLVARQLPTVEITSTKTKQLVAEMQATLRTKKLGVGLAAPQIGESIALAIILIQPTEHRPDVEPFELAVINPKITETFGYRKQLWEGCISAGSSGKADLFAKVPRYKKVRVKFYDQHGKLHEQIFEDLQAHVVQHEVDHLNGVLFVDKVKDTTSYMTYSEYKKQIRLSKSKK